MSNFFSMIFRMKYINRWGLMRNSFNENLSGHSFEVALIAHALAVISNKRLNIAVDADKIAVIALYHDAPEIITGDLPTPIKYHDEKIKHAYKIVEKDAAKRLLELLPDDIKQEYEKLLTPDITDYEQDIIKAADKIAALIKCIEEEVIGNREFINAKKAQLKFLNEMNCESANIFLEEFLPGFEKTLDEQ